MFTESLFGVGRLWPPIDGTNPRAQFSYLAPSETAEIEPRRENFGILSLSRILLGPRYGQSAATFNNLVAGETYYILPTNLYYYTGDTLRFVVPTNAQVEANPNQVPTVVPVFPYSSSTCIK